MDDILKKVRDFASDAHGEQKRKYVDEMYIRHPERVMYICVEYTTERAVLAAALLHDVLEDTPVTEEELSKFLHTLMDQEEADKTLQLVVDLTDIFIKADYPSLNRKKRKRKEAERLRDVHPDAQTIKYADIIDNASDVTPYDPDFALVYLKEAEQILSLMEGGEPQLYERAKRTVQQCRDQLMNNEINI